MAYQPSLADLDTSGYQPSLDDINDMVQSSPSNLDKMNYLYGLNRTPLDTLRDVASGAIGTLGKGGQLIASGLTGGYAPTVNFDDITNAIASPNQSIGGNVSRGVGSYLPFGAAAGEGLASNMLGAGATGFVNADPNQQNFFNLLPQGRTGSAIENAMLTGVAGKALDKIFPYSPQSANVTYSPQYTMPVSKSEFTNVPYTQPSFLDTVVPNDSERMANELHQNFIGNKSPEEAGKNVASSISNKYNSLKDNFKYRYANIFDRDSGIDYPQEEGSVSVGNSPLSSREYVSKFGDFDFPNDSLQALHDKLMGSKTVNNSQALQSELGGEIGYLKKQNSNGILDSSGKNLLSQYSAMRSTLKNDMYDSLESIKPGLGDQYNDVTSDWERDMVPFSSDRDLKLIAEGKTKNPASSQIVSIFKNPEENISRVSSMLGSNANNDIVRLGMGKGEFQNSPNDMISAHDAIYSKGLNSYLDPYYDQQFRNLRSTVNNEQNLKAQQQANQLLSSKLKSSYDNALSQSAQQSQNALQRYNIAKDEVDKIISGNKGLFEVPDKSSRIMNYLNPALGVGLGALVGHEVDNGHNSLLGAYFGKQLFNSFKKTLKNK